MKKIVVTPTTKDVIVQLRGADGKKFNVTATVAKDAKGVKPSQVPMPEGYEFYPGMYDANTEYPFSTEGTDPDHDFFFMIQKKSNQVYCGGHNSFNNSRYMQRGFPFEGRPFCVPRVMIHKPFIVFCRAG